MNDLKDRCSRILLLAHLLLMSACTQAAFTAANLPTHLVEMAVEHDRAYGSELLQKLDVYIPANTMEKQLDVLVFFYGGRWTYGAKEDYRFVAATCSAPLKSSHWGCLLRAVLDRAPIPEGAMGPFLVVPMHPVSNDPPRLLKRLEPVLPDTLVFQTSKEPLNQPILLGRIGRDELLLQPIVSTGLAKSATLENQPVIAT